MRNNDDLIIRITTGDSVYEIIPMEVLCNDFPTYLLDNHLHFLDLNRRKLEFRPNDWHTIYSESVWNSAGKTWVLSLDWTDETWSAHGQRTLANGLELNLIDYRSTTRAAFASAFEPLQEQSWTEVAFCPKGNKVHVILTRYKPELEFEFDVTQTPNGEIACRTLPGMVVDLKPGGQDMKTLYGLKSYLVLREAKAPSHCARRSVIIPVYENYKHEKELQWKYVTGEYKTLVWTEGPGLKYYLYSIDSAALGGLTWYSRPACMH